jgi:uncharacterized protein YkwD
MRAASGALAVAVAAIVLSVAPAHAEPAGVVNAIRSGGCGGQPGVTTRLQPNASLDGVARELARGTPLPRAVARLDYPAASSTSFHVSGSREDGVIERLLTERFCRDIVDARYTELGVHQNRNDTWIVLAARQPAAPVLEPAAVERRVLDLVNRARAEARSCGRQRFAAAAPLKLSVPLTSAALLHARDMARRKNLSHEGSDGSDSGTRIARAGYVWRASGENVAAGQRDADAVVAAWLESPGHCATLMGAQFTEMGIAFALAPGGNPGIYWAQTFGSPQ